MKLQSISLVHVSVFYQSFLPLTTKMFTNEALWVNRYFSKGDNLVFHTYLYSMSERAFHRVKNLPPLCANSFLYEKSKSFHSRNQNSKWSLPPKHSWTIFLDIVKSLWPVNLTAYIGTRTVSKLPMWYPRLHNSSWIISPYHCRLVMILLHVHLHIMCYHYFKFHWKSPSSLGGVVLTRCNGQADRQTDG